MLGSFLDLIFKKIDVIIEQNLKIGFQKNIRLAFSESNKKNNGKKATTYVMRRAEYDKIRDVLLGVKKLDDHNKKHAFKNKNYTLVDGKVARNIVNSKTNKLDQFKLVYLEEFFDILYESHCVKRLHCGITKTFEYIQAQYIGLPKIAVAAFREHCYICDLNKKQISQPRLTPIESTEILERVHDEISDNVERHWFSIYGLPKILQSDNGLEFKNKKMVDLVKKWDGDCKLVYGRPRHPQSQGLVEQSNGTIERMIAFFIYPLNMVFNIPYRSYFCYTSLCYSIQ